MTLSIRPVETAADRRRFVNLLWDVYRYDPHWVPPLKSEELALIDPDRNPWFEHARAKLWLAEQDGRVVGRVSAQVDDLVLQHMGAGTGLMGMLEALEHAAAVALLETAEEWLSGQGMQRVLGPISLSIWDQPGLLVEGFAQAPTAMMGHHRPDYRRWVEAAGYGKAKDLLTYELDIRADLGPLVRRLVEAGARNGRIRVRPVDKRRFEAEAAIILNLLNDAWSDNWGFVPLTAAEIAYAGKKLKPIIFEDLVYIAEVDGEPAAFMITIPDINELIRDLDGRLFPVGWAKLLWRLRKPQVKRVRVPLMGVTKSLQGSRMAGQLAFMLIERCRVNSIAKYGATHGEFGWVLEDNGGMMSIAQLPGAEVNKVYRIYEKTL
ncbi:MAG TPA: N-acetyltransferase [Sphingomicrobium sp.]|nr:N-acetyltransferase [Sphingomicrobium sp.]